MRLSPRTPTSRHRRRHVGRVAWVVLLLCGLAVAGRGAASALTTASTGTDATAAPGLTMKDFALTRSGTTYVVKYWSNAAASQPDPAVRNVVVTVHGDSRNADDYARYTADAASLAGKASTVVLAPWFAASSDAPRANQLYWSSDGWKHGAESVATGRAWTVSSFAVVDAMVVQANRSFPNARITVTGHSAGGQFVQRYVAFAGQTLVSRYVPMNAGSYLYLDAQRWSGGTRRALTAAEQKACSGWNSYKYGLSKRTGPVATRTVDQVRAAYGAARVTYLLGGLDTTVDSSLDTGCSATWEGANRLVRGQQFFAALPKVLGADAVRTHTLVVVPGVAHLGGTMIRSAEARALLFP